MELKNQEHDLQFSIWLIASIFLHILIFLILLFWYFETSLDHLLSPKKPESIVKPIPSPPLPSKKPILWTDLKKPEPKQDLQYTLIPGRQAVTEPNTAPADRSESAKTEKLSEPTKSLPKSSQQTTEPHAAQESDHHAKPQKQDAPSKEQQKPVPHPLDKTKRKTSWNDLQENMPDPKTIPAPASPKTIEQRHDDLKEKLLRNTPITEQHTQKDKDQAITLDPPTIQSNADNPTILKKKVTLKDLQLGFSKFMQEGNNDILVQHGNTNQSPDAQALRLITYKQQLARAMLETIHAHHQYHLVQDIMRLRPQFTITLERSGKLKNFTLISSSGNQLFDKILTEAIESVRLYPALPQHIAGDTFSMIWTLLH